MKKIKLPEKKTGVWLDQETAYLIRLTEGDVPTMEKLVSDVEGHVRIPGEGKVFARFGNAFLDDQEKKQRRQRAERKHFFQEIADKVAGDDFLYVFGPGRAKFGLQNQLEKEARAKPVLVALETADRLTRNQMMEQVLRFYEEKHFAAEKKRLRKEKKEKEMA